MMSDKPSLSGMPNRQKVMVILVVVILVVVVWQLMKLFTGGNAPAPKAPAPVASTTPAVVNATSAVSQTTPGVTVVSQTPVAASQQPTQSSSISSEVMKMQQEMQEKYIRSLNDLQMLRIQRDIAETNQAIVASKLATVTAEKNISDLLTPPALPKSPSGFAPTLVGGGPPPVSGPGVTIGQPSPPVSIIEYSVVSVAMQQGRWFAVLSSQGKLYTVNVGDVLPLDGSVVVTIDRSGVVIEKEGEKKKISMLTSG